MNNYENRHPDDMVLHPLSEIREWDEALAVLGIQDSTQTPADAIRERDAEIERQNARIEQLEAEVEKWHRVAMKAGAITCVGGGHIYPLRERCEAMEGALEGIRQIVHTPTADHFQADFDQIRRICAAALQPTGEAGTAREGS